MNIQLKKFGTTLASRQAGKEAYGAFRPNLESVKDNEDVVVDFDEVVTFAPSWGDEFFAPLWEKFGKRVLLANTDNPSVRATMELLKSIHGIK